MKKKLMLLIASLAILPGIVLGGDVLVNDTSNMNTQCNSAESKTYWFYLTESMQRNPYDNFINNSANSYITKHDNIRTGTSVDIWRHGNVISNCTNWNRTSTAVPKSQTKMIIQNQDGCTFNIPSYTKTNNPSAIDAQIHYNIGFVQFNYGSNPITDHLYYTTYGGNIYCFGDNPTQVNNGSNCPTSNITYSKEYFHVGECLNYKVFWCGDGLVNSETGTTYNNGTFTEQCDPNDPTHAGWNNNGKTCNPTTCQLENIAPTHYCGDGIINQESEDCDPGSGNFGNGCNSNCKLMTPSCTLTVNPNQGNVPLTTTISGTTNSRRGRITKIYFGDGESYTINNWNPILPVNHTYNTTGTFYLTGIVTNVYNGQIRTGAIRPVAYCSINVITTTPPPTSYCGDGILQSNEQCDPGSGNFGNGCNENCQLMTPTCTLTVNPNQGNIPLNTTINGTKPSWATYLTLNFGDGSPVQNNPAFALNHTYNSTGTFNLTLTVQNNYNGQINGTKPTATCSANVVATQPGSPVPYLLKQQKTGGMANFTTNQINVEIGETITYKVNFGNSGTVAATGEVWDILPPCVNYLTSSIHLPAGTTYNGPTVGPVNAGNQTMVKYSNFRLNPGQGGYMLVQAQVRGTGMNGMTSCQNTYSYLNTGYFKFVGGNTLQSAVVAVRPQAPQLPHLTINKELITAGDMTAGSTVVYKITLTNDGNATYHNAYILDILPNAIQYQTSSIQNITNYLFEEGTTGNNDYFIRYYNFDLAAGRSAIVYLTGILKQGFNFNQTVNCAFTSGDDSCVPFPSDPIPFIKKWQKVGNMSFTDEIIQVELGDTITYKVDFGNIGNRGATGQVWDILPPCVKYVSSSIHLPSDISYSGPHTGQQGVQDFVMYNNFYLAAGQTGYMLIEAKIKESGIPGVNCSDTRSYLNTGYFKFVGGQPLSSDVLAIREESAGSEVIFDKTGNKKLMHPGEGGLEFYITVTNKGPNPISNIYVDDIRPHEDCIIYKGWSGDESLIEYIDPLRRHYIGLQGAKTNYNLPSEPNSSQTHIKGTLYAGQSFNFTIFASVKNDPSCVGYYINKAILTYTEGGETHTLEDDYDFDVIDDNPDYACESLTSSGSIVILTGTNNQGKMRFTCKASDSNPHNIAIYCGNGRSGSASNVSSFEYTCIYSSTEEGSNYNAYCLVDGQEPTNPACIKNIGINPGLYGDCGNGTIEAGEDCDLKGNEGESILITDYLDYAGTIRAGQFEGNYCKNCKMITGNNFVYEPAECLYSDTPISVMENEIIPFWWRLRLKDNQLVGDNGCYADTPYSDSYEKGSSSNSNSSLSPRNKGTLLKKSSMKCTFSIYNGTNKLQGNNSVTTFTKPCFNNQENFKTLNIYQYFIENHKTENFNGGTEILTVNALLNGNQTKKYGEYKLVLEKVDYEYCDKTVGEWKKGKRYGAVCEVDFAVTKPYMMQVSTFGVNPVGSNGLAFLDDYYDMNGKKILDSTDLRETIDTENRNYAVSSDAKKQMDTFASKYKSLAVKVNTSSVKNLFGGNTNGIESVSKVPNQPIYFVKGNGGTLTLSQSKTSNKTAAYTIFVENANVEIVGKFLQYAMIITDGTISFKDNAGDSKDRCTEGGQVVQGIFVALKGFKESTPSLININENQERCARGGLHVKGVLIGSNIENLIKNRRSQLNSWFNVNYVGWTPQKIRTDRKKKIMEGAALLIEYSPELWKSLPPGAEIFTESLQVYRK